ncbi:unnamed protein product [Danaus chrysippus]|uniref:(African queen) hypothetical protein n=1 Tax=Danaus chrysippus TaxID=151541 RepID=A0A8J2VWT0_9NEOP|nr:unnamed protein product [Danaus chrysippus]
MSYESEQRRLLALFEQADASGNEQCSSDDQGEIDHISERSQGSDTEQECSDDEQEVIVSTIISFLFTAVMGARPCICPEIYKPVCSVDGVQYGNECRARCAGVTNASASYCR